MKKKWQHLKKKLGCGFGYAYQMKEVLDKSGTQWQKKARGMAKKKNDAGWFSTTKAYAWRWNG